MRERERLRERDWEREIERERLSERDWEREIEWESVWIREWGIDICTGKGRARER